MWPRKSLNLLKAFEIFGVFCLFVRLVFGNMIGQFLSMNSVNNAMF